MRGTNATQRAAARAARQDGNITFQQLRDCGLSVKDIERRTAEGWLIRRHARVYCVGHVPRSRESRFRAAVLALGDESALSFRAAGALWRIVSGAVPTEVTVPTLDGRSSRDGIVVHRAPLPARHVVLVEGIRCTSVLRTVLDLAGVLPPVPLSRTFEQAQVIHGLDPNLVAVECLSRRGYRGNGRLGRLLADAVDPARVRSVLELRFLKLCAGHGLERPLVNERIGDWTPDFYWPAHGLVVETDGFSFHRTAWARRRDAEKDAHMRALGLRVVRLTWRDVADRPAETAALIASALRAAA